MLGLWSPRWDSLEARLPPLLEALEATRPFMLDSWQSVKSVGQSRRQVGHPITHTECVAYEQMGGTAWGQGVTLDLLFFTDASHVDQITRNPG